MIRNKHEHRPTAAQALITFNAVVATIPPWRLSKLPDQLNP